MNQADKVNIDCSLDRGSFAKYVPEPKEELTVVSYNLDRNGYGEHNGQTGRLENIITILQKQLDSDSNNAPDIILLQELANDCYNFGNYVNGIREIAYQLQMHFAYVVEYINYEQFSDGNTNHQCTIGNGILSRYPIENIESYRFKNQCCSLGSRLGGRVALLADIKVSEEQSVRVNNVHLEAGTVEELHKGLYTRFKQS